MPPPLGAGGIIFSGCPSVRPSVCPSVRPSEAWNTLFWPVHGSVGPPDQPWPFYGMWCPSVRPERFPGICQRTHGENGLKFCTLMYLDHLQNWLVYGYGLLIFLILALFWLRETGQIWGLRAFSGERMKGMAWNFACWCITTTYRTDKFIATVCWFLLILALFWLSETGQIWGFRAFPGERMEGMAWNFACWCVLTTFRAD